MAGYSDLTDDRAPQFCLQSSLADKNSCVVLFSLVSSTLDKTTIMMSRVDGQRSTWSLEREEQRGKGNGGKGERCLLHARLVLFS